MGLRSLVDSPKRSALISHPPPAYIQQSVVHRPPLAAELPPSQLRTAADAWPRIYHRQHPVCIRDTIPPMATGTEPLTGSGILRAYSEKTARSRSMHQQARALLPDGITHVIRYLEPHPVYVERAAGSRKWDVDGNEYVDYLGGHGALILGHNHPKSPKRSRRRSQKECTTAHAIRSRSSGLS